MANTKSNVSVGKPKIGGSIWRAPVEGTTIPTDATSALTGFTCLGYVSSDGVTNANGRTVQNIRAWGGDVVLTTQTERTDTFAFELIESLNPEVLKTVYGDDNVTGTDISTGIVVTANGAEDVEHVYVIDQELRGGVKLRTVIPAATVTEVGDISYRDDQAIAYPVTLTALPDDDENYHYEYRVSASGSNDDDEEDDG